MKLGLTCQSQAAHSQQLRAKQMFNLVGLHEFSASAIGFSVVVLGPRVLVPDDMFWEATAISAVGALLLHGVILLFVYWKQRVFQERVVRDVRKVLQDEINNKLATICMTLDEHRGQMSTEKMSGMRENIDFISSKLETLTAADIHDWEARYSANGSR